jgi:hypothetical protein
MLFVHICEKLSMLCIHKQLPLSTLEEENPWRHIIQTSFLLGFGMYHVVLDRGRQQITLLPRICLMDL